MRAQCLQYGCLGMELVLRAWRPWFFGGCLYDHARELGVLPDAGGRAERELVLSFFWVVQLWRTAYRVTGVIHRLRCLE